MKIPKIRKLPSGNYFCQLRIDGQSISITEPTEELCEAKAIAYKAGLLKTRKRPDEMTVKQACEKWIAEAAGRLSPTTVNGYQRIVKNYFPSLMNLQLKDVDNRVLQKAVNIECKRITYRGKPTSPKSIQNAFAFVGQVLRAHDIETHITLPEVKPAPVAILTPEEVFQAVKGTPVELPVLLSMWLSFSMSEIRGLTKSKSIKNNQITIAETVVDVDGKAVRKSGGKEVKRVRTLEIPPYIKKLIDNVEGDVIVPASAASIANRFYRLLDKAGLPHMKFHGLRHINASVMAELQIAPAVANQRGGWKTNYTRERVYTHVFSDERRTADEKIDEKFSEIVSKTVSKKIDNNCKSEQEQPR